MARVYVGNLPMDVTEREVDDLFYKFGRIRRIDIKTPSRPPAFAFVEFEDRRDAEDAIYDRDGYRFDRERIRVEMAKEERGSNRDGDRGDRGRDDRKPKRTPFRITVSGLPDRTSWQDLKDFMRCGGDIVYADVDRRGGGVVEYSNREDMLHAAKHNDGIEFDKPYGRSVVKCVASEVDDRRSGSRSPSRSSSRDRGRGKSRRSPSRSDSRSPSRDRKKSSRDASPSPRSDRSKSPARARSNSR